jgi:uncharacterized membrane protein
MTDLTNASDCSRTRIIAYWVTTAIIAAEFAVGGVMDLLRAPLFFEILKRLGYPGYFSIILGIWKVLGAVAVVVPRFRRLKEWAYAGMFFTMTGAVASHLAVGDPAVMLVAPIVFTGLVLASWALRPPPRRDDPSVAASSRSHTIAYWVTTGLLALECFVGGVMGALRLQPFSGIMEHLAYPAYLMTILGVWYVLGGIAILVPRFPGSRSGPTLAWSSSIRERPPLAWRWVIPRLPWWHRSSSPASQPPPGPCARRLAAP